MTSREIPGVSLSEDFETENSYSLTFLTLNSRLTLIINKVTMNYEEAIEETEVFCAHFLPIAGVACLVLAMIFILVLIRKKREHTR